MNNTNEPILTLTAFLNIEVSNWVLVLFHFSKLSSLMFECLLYGHHHNMGIAKHLPDSSPVLSCMK